MPERIPASEFSAEELELIQILKERGPQDKDARAFLNQWLDREEEKANEVNTSRANIEVNLKIARLCAAAGLREAARENAENAVVQAVNEGEGDLRDEAQSILNSL